jgi:hypothetical protein
MITNKDIIDAALVLFAHTDAYNFPATFANRVDSRAFLSKRVGSRSPEITVISDILGTGKTFLLQMVQGELGLKDRRALICGRVDPVSIATEEPVFIDEWDIKANPKRIIQTLDLVKAKMRTQAGPVVLLGDYTIKSDEFTGLLEEIAPTAYVPMEPLNPSFFQQAMNQRLARAAENLGKPFEGKPIISAELVAALVPDWPQQTSANFRDVFRVLTQMAQHLEVRSDVDGRIGADEARSWLKTQAQTGMSAEQERFYDAYIAHLQKLVREGGWEMIKPLSEKDLQAVTAFETKETERFRIEISEPIARTPGLLSAMGHPQINFDGSVYHRFPGPYLPGIVSRLRVVF